MARGKSSVDKTLLSQKGVLIITNVLIPMFMLFVVILLLVFGVMYVFFQFTADSVINTANNLSQTDVKSQEEIEREYPRYIVVYYDINKTLITQPGYGNPTLEDISHGLPAEYYGLVKAELASGSYLVATTLMKDPYNDTAKYVRVYMNTFNEDSLRLQIVLICSGMFTVVFVLQSLLGVFAVKTQTRPLEKALERNTRLISDISHEFNTPLAIINTNISKALANPEEKVEDISESLVKAINETQRLKRMIKELLVLSSSDSKKMIVNMEYCNVSKLTEDICEPFAMMCEMDGKEFVDKIEKDVYSCVDKDKYRQILIALLDNALKYTVCGEKVAVYLSVRENKTVLSVRDTGKGVDEKDMLKIFERFYRSDESRNGKTGGTGLGLAIVKEIASNMKARVYARNNVPKGFIVEVEFEYKSK